MRESFFSFLSPCLLINVRGIKIYVVSQEKRKFHVFVREGRILFSSGLLLFTMRGVHSRQGRWADINRLCRSFLFTPQREAPRLSATRHLRHHGGKIVVFLLFHQLVHLRAYLSALGLGLGLDLGVGPGRGSIRTPDTTNDNVRKSRSGMDSRTQR